MDYSYINATSSLPNYDRNNSFDSSDNTFPSSTSSPDPEIFCWLYGTGSQFSIIFLSIWGPLAPLAIYCLYSQVRNDRVVPVFFINLLISDIIQICCIIVELANDYFINDIIFSLYNCSVAANIFFMTFIAMERYLLIASSFWYRVQQKLKVSASVTVVNWILSVYFGLNNAQWMGPLLIIPLPLLIFFLVHSIKCLSASHNVPPDERRQIIAVLTAVLFAYTLTFLPQVLIQFWMWGESLWLWDSNPTTDINFFSVSCTLIQLNPLTDLLLYFLIKKWVLDKLLAFLCCCRKTNNGLQQTNNITVTTCSWSASQGQTEAQNNP